MSDEREFLSEEEAARLWSRAAQLQAEAAQRAELALGPGSESAGDDESAPESGYALEHVVAAASEAGIGPEYLEAALVELRTQRALGDAGSARVWRTSRLLLGSREDAVSARRVVRADVQSVLAAMEAVLPADPYKLVLRDRKGDPTRGGVLVFDIPGAGLTGIEKGGFVGDASWANFRQVYATVTPRALEPGTSEMVVRAPVAWAMNLNASVAAAFLTAGSGVGIAVGAAGAVAIGTIATGGVATVLGAVCIAAVGGVGALGSLRGFRAIYRYALHRGENALEGLLSAVAAHAEGGWGLVPPPSHPPKEESW